MHEPGVITLDNIHALREQALQLAKDARRQLILFTPNLEAEIYHQPDFVKCTLDLIKRSKQTQVRILTQDTRQARECGHGLLKILRHTDNQFQIRKLTVEASLKNTAYLVSDDKHLLRRQNIQDYRALCYTHDRTRVKDQLEEFELLWNVAILDPDLRSLIL
jgi:hypothetical protein